MEKTILGHIDCPTCGTPSGMRITHDKNQEPFGFCESGCRQQLRIGGDPARVRAFVARHPWAAKQSAVPVTVTEEKDAPEEQEKPVPVPEQKPAPRRATFADALGVLGVGK